MFCISLFYKFVQIDNVDKLCNILRTLCVNLELKGRVLVAYEGLNGTLAGSGENVIRFQKELALISANFDNIDWKFSYDDSINNPFQDLFIRKAKELIGTGPVGQELCHHIKYNPLSFGGLDDSCTGIHLSAKCFHEEIIKGSARNNLILDIRNQIEYDIGHFKDSISIGTAYYSETWKLLDKIISDYDLNSGCGEANTKNVLMYCTGGIRCEKASAYLLSKGVPRNKVFQVIEIERLRF